MDFKTKLPPFILVVEINIASSDQSSELKRYNCEAPTEEDKGMCGPGKAHDGNMETSSVTDYTGSDAWWNATLEHETKLDRIEIYLSRYEGKLGAYKNLKVYTFFYKKLRIGVSCSLFQFFLPY